MKAKNKVIAGDYIGKSISSSFGETRIIISFTKTVIIDKINVESYEVVDETYKKSACSTAGRALVGSIFGGIGILAGALSAKNKGIHTIALVFKDGKSSLVEIDDNIYKNLIKAMF